MEEKSKSTLRPSILTGAIVGGLLTALLMALFFLGDRLAGLPFVPLDLFDWIARTLPGGLITFGIDTMVTIIETFSLGETSATAKTAEILMGLVTFLGIGIVSGAIFFYVMKRAKAMLYVYLPGVLLGLVVGIPIILISLSVNFTATASPVASILWMALLFIGWGGALSWVYNDLNELAPSGTNAGESANYAQTINRRQFLVRVGGATATLTVLGTGLAALLGQTDEPQGVTEAVTTNGQGEALPNASASLDPAPGTRPEYTPIAQHYRIDISSRPPEILEAEWLLPITGLVANPVELTLEQFRTDFEPVDHYVTLSCISNRIGGTLISTTKWTGVPLSQILELVQPSEDARAIKITSADSFDEFVDLDVIRADERIMLAYAWDDAPLAVKHGFPLRIWIPDRYGMKQPKWITGMEFVEEWEEGYWVRRGWSRDAIVKATSVVDTVAVDSIGEDDNGAMIVPIGGIAYAGARQISQVQVRVDEGEWSDARLREPLSDTTWVIWRYDWPFAEGEHRFEVRCAEGSGESQIEEVQPNRPNGATGIHGRSAMVVEPRESSS